MAEPMPHFPIIYAIIRPALSTGNAAVRQHVERLAEVLEGDQRRSLQALLDRKPGAERFVPVVLSANAAAGVETGEGGQPK